MGANWVDYVTSKTSREEIALEFRMRQSEDRYDNGHSYSGGIGMARGLSFPNNPLPRPSEDAAREELQRHAKKWEEALAVPFINDDPNGPVELWLVGAWCAS